MLPTAHDPHHLLGLHPYEDKKILRLWRPGAKEVHFELFGKITSARKVTPAGLFEALVPAHTTARDYRVYHSNGLLAHDPYAFTPTWGEVDQHLFARGVHYKLYNVMGGRIATHEGVEGARFALWAPAAKQVSLVGDFNHWDGRVNPMRSLGGCGVWELFVPGLQSGMKYKFEIQTQEAELRVKSDPYAFYSELRPANASVLWSSSYSWNDQAWCKERLKNKSEPQPMNVYEVHLGSWKRKEDGQFLNYRELAKELAAYCHQMGFTHLELLPIAEHPLDESWGYQVTGFYAVTSRFGTPDDFKAFVDILHQHNIGVILDWVPGHFPTDDFALARFDGTCLYEHADPRQGFHPHWNTCIFNYGRVEVTNFLIANALYWLEEFHIDGLRVDAVASMLYLDYGREMGQWIPNCYGDNKNLEAMEFLRHLNSIVHERCPTALMIAEESTSFPAITHPVTLGGLGFDLKWNMGWMNDTLVYISKDPVHRKYHQNQLTFGLLYVFTEKFISVLSHDEVVHGKRSLLDKMPGPTWQRFANLRLLYSYMLCQPGKKLLFMGGELGQWSEWACNGSLEWHLLQYPDHQAIQRLVRELNHFYLKHPALWERDFDSSGFEWVDFKDADNSIISYRRKSSQGELLCLHNFTPTYHPNYHLDIPNLRTIREVFNTDDLKYGGSGKGNPTVRLNPQNIEIQLAPLATMIFEIS